MIKCMSSLLQPYTLPFLHKVHQLLANFQFTVVGFTIGKVYLGPIYKGIYCSYMVFVMQGNTAHHAKNIATTEGHNSWKKGSGKYGNVNHRYSHHHKQAMVNSILHQAESSWYELLPAQAEIDVSN